MSQRRRDDVSRPSPRDRRDASHLTTQDKLAARQAKRTAKAAERKEKSEALKQEGNAFFRKGDYHRAVDCYQRAVRVHGRSVKPVLLTNLAIAYYKLGKFVEASETAERALDGDPKSVKARYCRGMARKNMEMWRAAAIDFRVVLRLDPRYQEEVEKELACVEECCHENRFLEDDDPHSDSEYELPGPDDKPELGESLSESSDCEHAGNGKPCKFHNHAGCAKGHACPFSHAPDFQSERDALGRNVCREYLMGVCRLGEKCHYAHSKEFLLQTGWWSTAEEIDKRKKIYQVQQKFQRAFMDFENSQGSLNPETEPDPAKKRSKGRKGAPRHANLDSRGSKHVATAGDSAGDRGTRVEIGQSSRSTDFNGHTKHTDDSYSSPEGHDSDERYEGYGMFGFTNSEVEELLCHGIKPWDDATEARSFLEILQCL